MRSPYVTYVLIAGVMLFFAGPIRADSEPLLEPDAFHIVDLSHPYNEQTVYWPTSPSEFELEVLSEGVTDAGFYYSANRLCTPEHGGTHLDAPVHFAKGAHDVAEIPLERLLAPAVVIDVTEESEADADYRLSRAHVLAFEERHGPIPTGAIVLLRTGWSAKWPDREAYLGDDTPGDASNLHFPSLYVFRKPAWMVPIVGEAVPS